MAGPLVCMVPRSSGIKFIESEVAKDQIPFNCNHSDLVKFHSEFDGNYQIVCSRIEELAKESTERLRKLQLSSCMQVWYCLIRKQVALLTILRDPGTLRYSP
jgi:hypothetical protein